MFSGDLTEKLPSYADIIHDVLSFGGGMNTKSSQLFLGKSGKFALKKDECIFLLNLLRTATGALEVRPGRAKVNDPAISPPAGDAVIRSLFELRPVSGSDRILLNAGNTVYYINGTVPTSLGTVATNNLRMLWCQFNDVALGINGVDQMVQVTAAPAMTNVAAAPQTGSAIASHRNRVWIGVGRTLKYCALGDHTDWTTPNNAGAIPIPTTMGKGCKALISLWDRLIVFTTDQVFQVVGTGPGDFKIEPINLKHGNEIAPTGVIAAGNDIYYGSANGCHSLSIDYAASITGDVKYDYASGAIEPTWQDITPANLPNVCAVNDTNRNLLIFLLNRNGTNNTEALVADYYHLTDDGRPTWSLYSNMPFACAAEVTSQNGFRQVLFGGYDGIVYQQMPDLAVDVTDDIPIQIQYVTDADTAFFSKLWRYMLLFTSGPREETLSCTITYDFGDHAKTLTFPVGASSGDIIGSTFTVGSSILGTAGFRQKRLGIAGHGRFATVNLSASVQSRLVIGGFILYTGIRRTIHH